MAWSTRSIGTKAARTVFDNLVVHLLMQGTGMNLRSPIQGMFAYPTLVLFCEGKAGIAAAKALIEATPDSGGLNFPLRQDVRMYYRVSLTQPHTAPTTQLLQLESGIRANWGTTYSRPLTLQFRLLEC